ncbi:MAG: HD domain-containing protein [Candidatus Omnitrophica bacterium]|jgi:putative nucleotidyltransferase with HDIG domain|nr:HD domain-containing protein [Candidatus Omnitrophota bacterium]MDD5078816.1 HD domain-containing protein [Candidatus Omnitrophota bacterium]
MDTLNRILLFIDNEELIRTMTERLIIEGGYSVVLESTLSSAVASFKENGFDMVICKFDKQPDSEGVRLTKSLREINPECIIVGVLDKDDPELAKRAGSMGIYEFISRPFNWEKIFFIIRKAVELHAILAAQRKGNAILKEQNNSLQKQNILLAKRIEESTKNLARLYEDLRSTYMRTIRALAQAIDARDHYTHSHSENVAKYAVAIARNMGLSIKENELIRDAAALHDLGKIGISDSILLKPGGLTPEEWETIRKHPETGAQILEPLTFLSDVIELVRQHHEHFNGSGYPKGLQGDNIHIGARIIHLADAYEAMTSARSYRKVPLSPEQAIAEVERNAGIQFDPDVVDAFLSIASEL